MTKRIKNKKKKEQDKQHNHIDYQSAYQDNQEYWRLRKLAEQSDADLRRIEYLFHRMIQFEAQDEDDDDDDDEEEEEERQEEADTDVSFATSTLLTCFDDFEKELKEAISSLNEIKTSNREHTLSATIIMQNGLKYVPPHLTKVKEDGKEHHQGARHKKEEASRDPNFDRDNPKIQQQEYRGSNQFEQTEKELQQEERSSSIKEFKLKIETKRREEVKTSYERRYNAAKATYFIKKDETVLNPLPLPLPLAPSNDNNSNNTRVTNQMNSSGASSLTSAPPQSLSPEPNELAPSHNQRSPSATTSSPLLLLPLSNDDGRTSNFNSDNPTSPTLSSLSLNNRKDRDKEDDVSFVITSSPKQNKNTTSNEEHTLPTT